MRVPHAFWRCRLSVARLPPEAMTGRKELVGPAGACRCARRIFVSPTFFGVLVARITAEQVRPMLKRESFPIAKIYVPVKRRATLRPEAVREIAESMLEIGQETPILVRRDGDRFVLVEGLHRLEACKALGEETIVGFLVSAQSNHEKAPSPHDAEADAIREKTERLRKLRLAEVEKKRRATSDVVPTEAAKSSTEKPSRSGHIATRAKPATLADWLVARERDGFRD
jgi:uncharacterized ParB-like nuclease family protein